jgi:hypothetical protein
LYIPLVLPDKFLYPAIILIEPADVVRTPYPFGELVSDKLQIRQVVFKESRLIELMLFTEKPDESLFCQSRFFLWCQVYFQLPGLSFFILGNQKAKGKFGIFLFHKFSTIKFII